MNNDSDISTTPTKKEKNKEKRKKGHVKDDSVVFKSAEESKKNMKYDSSSLSISPAEKVNKKSKLKDGSTSSTSTVPAGNVKEEKNMEDDSSSSRMAEKQKKKISNGSVTSADIEKKKIKEDSSHTTDCTKLAKKEKRKKTKDGSNTPDVSEKNGDNEKKKKRRHVSFSSAVEIFPLENQEHNKDETDDDEDDDDDENQDPDTLVRGIRFSVEEDQKIKDAIDKYITVHQLGEKGMHMVLNCIHYPQVRNCWKEIGACLPHRPHFSVYQRAHILLERSENRNWDSEECEIIQRFYDKLGAKWKVLATELGKQRLDVRATWRRIRFSNRKRGPWTQDECQTLFDLVNLDLRMKAFVEKKPKDGRMLRENVAWEAIGDKLTTRTGYDCCRKWYDSLSSPLVRQSLWVDSDDYRLIAALQKIDVCCFEDVDWDNLLEHRSGEICCKRWAQMVRGIGFYKLKSFTEQVEVLSKRYCPEMLQYRNVSMFTQAPTC